jgi:hypothetical protein
MVRAIKEINEIGKHLRHSKGLKDRSASDMYSVENWVFYRVHHSLRCT